MREADDDGDRGEPGDVPGGHDAPRQRGVRQRRDRLHGHVVPAVLARRLPGRLFPGEISYHCHICCSSSPRNRHAHNGNKAASAPTSAVQHRQRLPTASGSQTGVLYLSLYLVALGTGGLKSSVSGFGTDQFDEKDPKEKTQMTFFFSRFFFLISTGTLLAVTVLVYIQDEVGRSWAYGICSLSMVLAISLFLSGTRRYRYKKSAGSPIVHILQVVVASVRKRKLECPANASYLYEDSPEASRIQHTDRFRFLDKAAIVAEGDYNEGGCENASPNPWRVCSLTRVEEVKMLIRLLPVWATTIMFWTTYAQMITFSVEQAATMERSIGSFKIPAGSLTVFFVGAILITLAVYDRVIMPLLKKWKGKQVCLYMFRRLQQPAAHRHRPSPVRDRHGRGGPHGDEAPLGRQARRTGRRHPAHQRLHADPPVLLRRRGGGLHIHRTARLLHHPLAEGDEDDEHRPLPDHPLARLLPQQRAGLDREGRDGRRRRGEGVARGQHQCREAGRLLRARRGAERAELGGLSRCGGFEQAEGSENCRRRCRRRRRRGEGFICGRQVLGAVGLIKMWLLLIFSVQHFRTVLAC
ncbi:protein NRT1/ PTR FAMILY 6.2 [Iris pallida]|uniref:Protein NRT1/ PTR FAMILY 6.2 n=1 Tax=Iris pallida TaxID=29817 RepID=A0AAX6I630_IRIPA|nr:protein NRT1/ PTR FAMILY 6.2 [Iris pallida]